MTLEGSMRFLRAVVYCLATLLIYLGVCLLGWGLRDLQGFFALDPRVGYAVVVSLFALAVGIQAFGSIEGIRGHKGKEEDFVFRQRIVRIGLVLSLYVALFFIPFFDARDIGVFEAGNSVRWLGDILCVSGYALVFLSGLALGRQYSADVTIQEDHHLITGSIYRYIRHPRYLGIILLAIGLSLVFRSWIGLLACVAFSVILIFRIRDEEALLHKEFGGEWESYCEHSWRLFPYIY
jgi:protein-S-isoprenylcysteine O-methyltransferase Ste14